MAEGGTSTGSPVQDQLRVLRRRRWVVLATVLLVAGAVYAASSRQDSRFSASAGVLLNTQYSTILSAVQELRPLQDPERFSRTQAYLAGTRDVAVRALRLAGYPRFEPESDASLTPKQLLENSSVTADPDLDLLEFEVAAGDRDVAQKLATAYARAFTDFRQEIDTNALRLARLSTEARVRELRRSGDSKTPLFESLIARAEQLRTLERLQKTNTLLAKPAAAAKQTQPNLLRNTLLGLTLGLILGVGLAFLREALETSLRSAEEIASILGIPMLARIPRPTRRLRRGGQLAMLTGVDGPDAEIYRILRINLEIANIDRGASTILVTSALEGEGKSTTIANLAVALAAAGRRIVLVDLDLRHSRLHQIFGLDGSEGVSQILLGTSSVDDVIQTVEVPGAPPFDGDGYGPGRRPGKLEIVTAGIAPANVGELVASSAIPGFFEELTERADLVLIDTPPLLPVGDAISLSAGADSLFLVTHLTMLKRPTVRELRRVLNNCPTTKLGFALTGAESEELAYGGAYGNTNYGPALKIEAGTRG